jgi:hypothetical protein
MVKTSPYEYDQKLSNNKDRIIGGEFMWKI